MLRVSNLELLRIQCDARELAAKDPASSDHAMYREHAVSLIAEIFDEAALQFQEDLQSAVGDEELEAVSDGSAFRDCVHQVFAKAFGFLVNSSPALALPVNARAQALRAATAFDQSLVRHMLKNEISSRIERSVELALLQACVRGSNLVITDGEGVLQEIMQKLLGAFDRLATGVAEVSATASN